MTRVTLHVYDLGPTCVELNRLGRVVGTGAYHAGVEVYGLEWSFGPAPLHVTGVCHFPPRRCPHHIYREPIQMGCTRMSKREVDVLIGQFMQQWPGTAYDLLRRNCCHFSNDLCVQLGVGPIPDWVTSLADTGGDFRSTAKAIANVAMNPMEAIVDLGNPIEAITDAIADLWQAPLKVGDKVKVFSRTCQCWCYGVVKSKDPEDNTVTVAFTTPERPHETTFKNLSPDSEQLQRIRRGGC